MCDAIANIYAFLLQYSEGMTQLMLSIITGLYSGLVVARYQEFSSLREEACRVVFSYEKVGDWYDQLEVIATALLRAKHTNANKRVREAAKMARDLARDGKIDPANPQLPSLNATIGLVERRNEIAKLVRQVRPSMLRVVVPVWRG